MSPRLLAPESHSNSTHPLARIQVRRATTAEDREQCFRIRHAVFCTDSTAPHMGTGRLMIASTSTP